MSERRTNRPSDMEFSRETKIEALKRANWQCECCGVKKKDTKEGYLELHHRLGVMLAVHHYPEFAHTLIASLANCQVLCIPCHDAMDRLNQRQHKAQAQRLKGSIRENYVKSSRLRL